ncbi:MAG: DUF6159 family protein [Solirubrobacterales bacterium]
MFRRIKNGWQLHKKSWGILRGSPGLIRFPLVAVLVGFIVGLLTLIPGVLLLSLDQTALNVLGLVVLVIGFLLIAVIASFFAVALAHNADRLLAGEAPSFGDGTALARQRTGPIFSWAIISTAVGALIGLLQDKLGVAGAILGGLAGAAWGVLTFLAIPVIALEGTGGFDTFKRCTQLIKERWGEQITGTALIGGVLFLIGYLPAFLVISIGIALWAAGGIVAGGVALIVIGILAFTAVALLNQALATIFGVALYHYAASDKAVGVFTNEDFADAVTVKGGMPPGMENTTV